MKNILVLLTFALISLNGLSQTSAKMTSTFYVNVLINANKEIRVENNLVAFEDISEEVKKIIYNHSFKLDEGIAYRIYADKNLPLGYIMDVEQEMFEGYTNDKTWRERHLLETVEMDIDGSNWLKKLDGLNLERTKE